MLGLIQIVFAAMIVYFVIMQKEYYNLFFILILDLIFVLPIYSYHINFEEDKIVAVRITRWFTVKKRSITYDSIKTISLAISRLNEEQKDVHSRTICPYLEFNKGNFDLFWIDVMGFSKKQVAEMLKIIGEKTGLYYTAEELLKNKMIK